MKYYVGFFSYTFGVNLLLTTYFVFGLIRVSKAHQNKIVALVSKFNISNLLFHMDNDQANPFELLIVCK
jgi:hypothetical protein